MQQKVGRVHLTTFSLVAISLSMTNKVVMPKISTDYWINKLNIAQFLDDKHCFKLLQKYNSTSIAKFMTYQTPHVTLTRIFRTDRWMDIMCESNDHLLSQDLMGQ